MKTSDYDEPASDPAPVVQERDTADNLFGRVGQILVADDDPTIRRTLVSYFEAHDLPATAASTQSELRRRFAAADPSLVILDLGLGAHDGLDLLRELRSRTDVPIIVTTCHPRDEVDRAIGLELGADDYLVKPFAPRELLARVRAVLRRQEMGRTARVRDPERGGYRFDGWQLERRRRRLVGPRGNHVELTKGEYALLLALLQAPQRPLTRERLLQATRAHEDIFDRSIDIQILRLRRKLEIDPSNPRLILTERGVGYLFAPTVEPF